LIGATPMLASHEMELFLTRAEEKFAREFIVSNGLESRRVLGVHVGSGATKNLALKRWPLSSYVELLKHLTKAEPQLAVLLFGGSEEREPHARIRAEISSAGIFFPETRNFRQTAALLK